ncbi:MAG: SpoIIE family protein phosphatase [Halanaerobium sp.]
MEKSELKQKAEKEIENIEIEADNNRDLKEVIQDLKVHQLELEYQNDELKETQSKLLEMRDKYHLLYEFAPISYFTFDKNGVIINTNLQATEMLNAERKYLLNKPFLVYLCSESQSVFYEHLKSVISDKSLKKAELVIKNKKGKKINVLIESNYIKKEASVQSAVIDITERIEAENQLKKNKRYIESVVNSIPDIILKLNQNGKYLDVINGRQKYLYKEKELLIGQNIRDLFTEDLAKKFIKTIKEALKDSEIKTIKYQLEVPAGNCCFEARINSLSEEEVIVLIRDITKESKQKEIIDDYTAELENKQMELEYLYYQLDQEVNKANKIHQRTLNNETPSLANYQIDSYYQPAEKMGGDFYETMQVGNKLICYISDVTGHGLDAAMMSSFIKSTINSFLSAVELEKITPQSISKFLAEQFLNENYPEDYFICLTIIVINLDSHQMEYLSLGIQDPILLYRKKQNDKDKGNLIKLISRGLPISPVLSLDIFDFEQKSIKLEPGDTIIFNTDGITEARNEGEYFAEKFEEVFNDNAFLPPAVISRRIIAKFSEFNGGSLQSRDDITYLILKRREEKTETYNFEIESNQSAVKTLQSKIYSVLPNSVSSDVFAMGLHELIVNAVEHGNKMKNQKIVKLKLFINECYNYAVIEDQGAGFDWKKKLDKEFNINCESDRGRGIMMTYKGCNEFFYNKKGNKAFILKLNDF